MFLDTLLVESMSDVVEFLKESSILVATKRKKISVVYEELRNFLPCYFDMLPIDIKTLIIKKILKYEDNSIYKSSKRWLKKYKLFIPLLGRDIYLVMNSLFEKHPLELLTEQKNFSRTIQSLMKELDVKNVAVYSWDDKKRNLICFLSSPDMAERFDFEPLLHLTVHQSETVVSRLNKNNTPSYENYYTEGIYLNEFKPIQYVNKIPIAEFFF